MNANQGLTMAFGKAQKPNLKKTLKKKKKAGYSHRTATTAYPCYLPVLGEFSRSWPYETCRCKYKAAVPFASQQQQIFLIPFLKDRHFEDESCFPYRGNIEQFIGLNYTKAPYASHYRPPGREESEFTVVAPINSSARPPNGR